MLPQFTSQVADIVAQAKSDGMVYVIVAMPDGAWGCVPISRDLWEEKDAAALLGPPLVRQLKAGHDELLRGGGPVFTP